MIGRGGVGKMGRLLAKLQALGEKRLLVKRQSAAGDTGEKKVWAH